jgi:ribosomal protein S4E
VWCGVVCLQEEVTEGAEGAVRSPDRFEAEREGLMADADKQEIEEDPNLETGDVATGASGRKVGRLGRISSCDDDAMVQMFVAK